MFYTCSFTKNNSSFFNTVHNRDLHSISTILYRDFTGEESHDFTRTLLCIFTADGNSTILKSDITKKRLNYFYVLL